MLDSSRDLSEDFLATQARVLRLDLSVVDSDALLERTKSGLEDLDRSDEIGSVDCEPAVTFRPAQDSR